MIVHDMPQGSPEWFKVRMGIPTASHFDSIITPSKLKPSSGRDKYLAECLAEYLMGQPIEWGSNQVVERGTDLEAEARKWYSFTNDIEVQQVGFVTRDDGLVGGSPDGLVGDKGVLEIKNYMAVQHVLAMLGKNPDHIGQVQGLLYLTERDWCDILCYNPELPPRVFRVERNEEYLKALVPVLDQFIELLEKKKVLYEEHRILRPWMEDPVK